MRYHFWQFLIDEEGRPIKNAAISVYEAGTDVPLFVYFNETGPDGTNIVPHLYTDNSGLFQFWVGDESEEEGYLSTTKIKIKWSKMGMFEGQIDHINIFPSYEPVNVLSSDGNRNKLVSNLLAKGWEDHVKLNNHIIHGINEVNLTSTTAIRNKLVSNFLGKGWEDHKNATWLDIPHGIQLLNINEPMDDKINKLVSNKDIREISTYDSNELPLNLTADANAGVINKPSRIDHTHSYSNLMTIEHPANDILGLSQGYDDGEHTVNDVAINTISFGGFSNKVARADHIHTIKNLSHHQLINLNNDNNFLHITRDEKNKYEQQNEDIEGLLESYQFIYSNISHLLNVNIRKVDDHYVGKINDIILVDTRNKEVEIYLPANPKQFSQIKIIDIYDNFNINNVIVEGNGKRIKELYERIILDQKGVSATLMYISDLVDSFDAFGNPIQIEFGWIFI